MSPAAKNTEPQKMIAKKQATKTKKKLILKFGRKSMRRPPVSAFSAKSNKKKATKTIEPKKKTKLE